MVNIIRKIYKTMNYLIVIFVVRIHGHGMAV